MKAQVEHRRAERDETLGFTIETVEDYELATRRVAALDAGTGDADTGKEREALLAAIRAWDAKNDDASGWKD